MSEMEGEKIFLLIMLGICIGGLIGCVLDEIYRPDIGLDQETADDICYNLTGEDGVIASAEYGKLVCEVPSFDSTSNIIVRKTGEGQ